MFGEFFRKLFGSSTQPAPEVPPVPPAPPVHQPSPNSTGVPNPDGSTSGFRPDGTPFVAHPFHVPIEGKRFFREAQLERLTRPTPPGEIPPDALKSSEQWFERWDEALAPQTTTFSRIDQQQFNDARSELNHWQTRLQEIMAELADLKDFPHDELLSEGNHVLNSILGQYLSAIHHYLEQGPESPLPSGTVETLAEILIDFYVQRNDILHNYYQQLLAPPVAEPVVEDIVEHDVEPAAASTPAEIEVRKPPSPPAIPYELSPVEGVSLHDYVAASDRIHNGTPISEILAVLGLDRKQWDEAAMEWQQRIEVFPESVGKKYTNFMSKPHPLFPANEPQNNSERLITDREFYIEVAAAVNATTEVGIDAGDFIEECYGVSLPETTAAGVHWMSNVSQINDIIASIQTRQSELVTEMRGVADDPER